MKRLLAKIWHDCLEQVDAAVPNLRAIVSQYQSELRAEFPLGWLRPAQQPYFIWISERTAIMINAALDWFQDLFTLLPARLIANIAITEIEIDPKLRQRVMTLDQVALFPARVIVDLGLQKLNEQLPRSLAVADWGMRWEKIFSLSRDGKLSRLWSLMFGSWWGRALRIGFLVLKFGQAFAYVVLLYRYLEELETFQTSPLFNAKLSQRAKRKSERVTIRRRIGGVKP